MDETTYVVTRGDREVDLSPTEWRLLRYLLMNAERVLSKQRILSYVLHYDHGGEEGSVFYSSGRNMRTTASAWAAMKSGLLGSLPKSRASGALAYANDVAPTSE